MYYVRLEAAEQHKRVGAHKTRLPWGVAAADAHFHDIGLHPTDPSLHYTLMVPGYAAADLVAVGARVLGIFEIRNGKFIAAPITDVSRIDVRKEIETAPDQEVRRYLTHHDAHPAHEHRAHITHKVRDVSGRRVLTQIDNPALPTADALRRRALDIHDAKARAQS